VKKSFLIFISSLLSLWATAAKPNPGTIGGIIIDEAKNKLPFATVMLRSEKDSSVIKAELSTEEGSFQFSELPVGNYIIETRYTGYSKMIIGNIKITEEHPHHDLGIIAMKQAENTLQGVTVTADKPFIEKLPDRTVVNIENSIIYSGGSLLDVMEKLPAVQVNQDGRVSLRGKPTVIILLDGKPMGVAGQDLSNILKGIPSSNIQKIEIITNPSAKYDAAGNAGIINIITKKNRREGLNGSANATYAQGRYEKYNSGFNLGFKNRRVNFYSSYNYSFRKGFNNLMLTRNFYRNDSLNTVFETDDYILFPIKTQTPRMGADITLGKKTSLSLVGAGIINDYNPSANNHTDIYDGSGNKVSAYQFRSQSEDHLRNYSINSQLKHEFDSSGTTLTADLDYAKYWNNSKQVFTNSLYDSDGIYIGDKTLLGDQSGNLSIYSAKSDFSKPIGKDSRLEAGAKSSYVEMESNIKFFNLINGLPVFDSTQSNHFLYNENINAGYVNFNRKAQKLNVQLGLRGEQTIAHGKQLITGESFNRKYFQLFPSAFLDYTINKKHGLNLSLSRRIDRPAYQQMNPFRKLIDATTYATGNPNLLPQLTYNSELTWSFAGSLFVTLGYSYTYNNITDVLVQDAVKRITVQTFLNLQQYHSYSANVVYSKKLTSWWTTNTSLFSYYGLFIGTVNNYNLNQGYPSFTFNSSNSFKLNKGFSAELSLLYNHKSLYGVTLVNRNYNLTVGFQKNILDGKGNLVLNCSDIFWRAWPSGYTDFGNVNESWRAVRDTRQVSLTFNYRFGKGQVKVRKSSGADTEKGRAGG
jgi:hypothetical protein